MRKFLLLISGFIFLNAEKFYIDIYQYLDKRAIIEDFGRKIYVKNDFLGYAWMLRKWYNHLILQAFVFLPFTIFCLICVNIARKDKYKLLFITLTIISIIINIYILMIWLIYTKFINPTKNAEDEAENFYIKKKIQMFDKRF